jgi:serine/threonine-protein kinase
MSTPTTQLMQHLLEKGLLTQEEVDQARGLLEEAAKAGRELSLTDALLRAGVMTARKAHLAAALAEGMTPAVEELVAPAARASGLQVLERIGRGSQAVVYKCRQTSLDRVVAVKFLLASAARDEASRKRFVQEARSAARLSHPNIVAIHEICPYKDTFYIVMEYVDGGALHELLAVRKRFDLAEAVTIIRGAAAGLAHAHARGIIHRDIKPKNIMLTQEGVPKLADMGLAREVAAGEVILQEAGKAYGTPYYISPEQVTGDPPVDFRTDLYSLGATLYEMVAGRPPFTAPTPQEIMRKHVIERLPDPREFVPDLPQSLCWFLAKAMAKEPEDRYESAEDFIAALGEIDFSEVETSASAAPDALVAQITSALKEERRRQQSGAAAGPLLATPVAVPGHPAAAAARADRLPLAVPQRPTGRRIALIVGLALVGVLVVAGGVLLLVNPWRPSPGAGSPPDAATAARPPHVLPPPPESLLPPKPKPPKPPTAAAKGEPPAETPVAKPPDVPLTAEAAAQEALRVAKEYEGRPGVEIAAAITGYQNVVDVYPDTPAAAEARKAVERLTKKSLEVPPPPPPGQAGTPSFAERFALGKGTVTLPASKAFLHGPAIRYETGANRDNIGFWHEESAWASWDLAASEPGTFTVELTYAAPNECSGNEFVIALADQELTGKVTSTGDWSRFKTETVGTIRVTQTGNLTLVVKPGRKPTSGLMNLRAVTLKRAAD